MEQKGLKRRLLAFQTNGHAMGLIQHPSGEGVRARQAKHKRAKAHPLHHPSNTNCARYCHDGFTTQPRPCQPIWVTLPSSTSMGTVRCPPVAAESLAKAAGSASTSYSSNSHLCHSSHSRISCVNG